MNVEMKASVYLALCGLVKDALQFESDATPLLREAAHALAVAAEKADGVDALILTRAESLADEDITEQKISAA